MAQQDEWYQTTGSFVQKAPPPKEQTMRDLANIAEGKGPTPYTQEVIPNS